MAPLSLSLLSPASSPNKQIGYPSSLSLTLTSLSLVGTGKFLAFLYISCIFINFSCYLNASALLSESYITCTWEALLELLLFMFYSEGA
jgi:hypothetical protein